MFEIKTTPRFDRMLKSFIFRHPEFREKTISIMNSLSENPYTSRFKTHRLSGPLKGSLASAISSRFRIVFYLTEKQIWFVGIGSHDEVY